MGEEIKDKVDIFGETFSEIDLSGTKLSYAEFDDCTFVKCDFSSTFFYSCVFRECRFENCNLSMMKLTDCKIGDVDFISSKLRGIDWTMCNWESILSSEGLRFDSCVLSDSNFYGLKLDGLVLKECIVKDADLRETSLKNGDFTQSDFEGSLFGNCHLQDADFSEAKNLSIKVSSNHFKNTKISHFEALSLLELDGIIVK